MNFQDMLKQQLQQQQNNNNNEKVEYPSNSLKHKELYFDKNTKSLIVRILPPAETNEFFAVGARELYLTTRNKNGKDLRLQAVLPEELNPNESNLARNLIQWKQEKRVPNNFNREATPGKVFYVNVIQIIVDQAGNMTHEVDQQGQPVVRLMKLKQSAYAAILAKLADPFIKPEGSDDYSFISALNAFPVRITKPEKGAQNMSYTIDVYQRPLGALPPNWKDSLEDLAYQATPSEVYNSDYVNYFIDVVNGVEGQGNQGGQAQAPVTTMQQPPVQQQQQWAAPAQQAPQQQWGGAPAPAPTAPQQVDQAMDTMLSNVGDTPDPFLHNTAPEIPASAPTTPPAQQNVQTPPAQTELPDVNDLLAKMKANLN